MPDESCTEVVDILSGGTPDTLLLVSSDGYSLSMHEVRVDVVPKYVADTWELRPHPQYRRNKSLYHPIRFLRGR